MPRRILHVVPAVAARYGGPSVAVLGMSKALIARGEHSLIVTTNADGPNQQLPIATGTPAEIDGVPVMAFARQASESLKWSRPLAAWLRQHAKDFDLAHVHAVFSHSSVAAASACRAAGVPYIVRPLGTLDPWSMRRHAWRKQLMMATGVRRMLAGASALHYTTSEERRLVEQAFPFVAPGVVVPLAVDEAFFSMPDPTGDRPGTVLFLGRLDAKKGVELLIAAFQQIAAVADASAWRLVIAGDGDREYVAGLRRLAAAGPAQDRIVFHGWATGATRLELFGQASIFVLPSHQENFGISIVEAMASGVAVVVTPGVNLARDIEAHEAGWVVDAAVPALAATLQRAMVNTGERARRGVAARRFATRFRWPAVVDMLVAMYDHAIDRHRCAA
jgi:glycosyltransferase involved in cell wall biosynthesis